MIRIRTDQGEELDLTYEQFIAAIQEGRVHAGTPVMSDVLTSGVWKPAVELQFFRSWAPKGTLPPRAEPLEMEPSAAEGGDESPIQPETRAEPEGREMRSAPAPWVPYGSDLPGGTAPPPGTGAWAGRPASGPAEPLPWERMDRIGFLQAFKEMIRLAFGDPGAMAAGIRAGSSIMPALVFGLLIVTITALADAAYGVAMLRMMKGMILQARETMPEMFGHEWPPTARDVLFSNGLGVLFYPAMVVLWSIAVHLILRAFGRPEMGLVGTIRAANYAMAPQILAVLPICGRVVGAVWSIVLMVRLIAGVHRTGGGVALLAVLMPLLGICLWMTVVNVSTMMQLLPSLGGSM